MAVVKELGQVKIESIRAGPDEPYGVVLGIITLFCVGFAIFVGTLLCFHSYLISENFKVIFYKFYKLDVSFVNSNQNLFIQNIFLTTFLNFIHSK